MNAKDDKKIKNMSSRRRVSEKTTISDLTTLSKKFKPANPVMDEIFKDEEMKRTYFQEGLILQAQEAICGLMIKLKVNKEELARRMGCHKNKITKIMSDEIEIDLRCLSDMFLALGYEPKITFKKITKK